MPELPDVEIFRRYMQRTSLRKRIRDAELAAPEMLEDTSPRALKSRLKGEHLTATRRWGKYLFTELEDGGWLLLHFGMTGSLKHYRSQAPEDHVRLRLDFGDGSHLAFSDIRKFGRIGLVDDVEEYAREHNLGPDPLDRDFDLEAFRTALSGRKTAIKTTLINQEVLAGIGNVYADEILFQAGLNPQARTDQLRDETVKELYQAMGRVLEAAIRARARPDRLPKSFVIPQRRTGGECPRCGRELKKVTLGGRTTWFCSVDQRRLR